MVRGAVTASPCSAHSFPDNCHFAANLAQNEIHAADLALDSPRNEPIFGQIPCLHQQGIFSRLQGIFLTTDLHMHIFRFAGRLCDRAIRLSGLLLEVDISLNWRAQRNVSTLDAARGDCATLRTAGLASHLSRS